MLFSSLTFLLYFFPAVILIHYALPGKWQNAFLLLSSLVFYAWGDGRYLPLFFLLLLSDWGLGLAMGKARSQAPRRLFLAMGLGVNLGALLYYKYSAFLFGALNLSWSAPGALPLGISFFTFQAVGYLIDVYRGKNAPEKNLAAFGAFIFMFPQLIAGPILRYEDAREALGRRRRPDGAALEGGMALFAAGLGAKALLANPLGAWAESLRAFPEDRLCAWLYLAAFGLQIYFDFLGYSTMAVGMGRMLGFSFPRNFRHPYAAASVTDFWRRWHMTLGGWFRDYVYIPLGGNRQGAGRTLINMAVVWLLTGIWHGAGWNFILWGLWYFLWLAADRFLLQRLPVPGLRRITMYAAVFLGWGLFACEGMPQVSALAAALFAGPWTGKCLFGLRENAALLLVSAALCCPWLVEKGKELLRKRAILRWAAVTAVLLLSLAALTGSTYNPFLYFHF